MSLQKLIQYDLYGSNVELWNMIVIVADFLKISKVTRTGGISSIKHLKALK